MVISGNSFTINFIVSKRMINSGNGPSLGNGLKPAIIPDWPGNNNCALITNIGCSL
jgi:hypothetical protein